MHHWLPWDTFCLFSHLHLLDLHSKSWSLMCYLALSNFQTSSSTELGCYNFQLSFSSWDSWLTCNYNCLPNDYLSCSCTFSTLFFIHLWVVWIHCLLIDLTPCRLPQDASCLISSCLFSVVRPSTQGLELLCLISRLPQVQNQAATPSYLVSVVDSYSQPLTQQSLISHSHLLNTPCCPSLSSADSLLAHQLNAP